MNPARRLALVSQDLVKETRGTGTKEAFRGFVLLVAFRYQGKMKGKLAEFTVQFDTPSTCWSLWPSPG